MPGVISASQNAETGTVMIEASDANRLPVVLRKAREAIQSEYAGVTVSYNPPADAEDKGEIRRKRMQTAAISVGAILFAAGLIVKLPQFHKLALFLVAYLLIGGEVLVRAVKGILKGGAFDECFLMSIATIGAFAIGEYPEGIAVMLFYQIGEAFEHFAVGHSRRSISALMDIRPDSATLKSEERLLTVAPEEVAVGETIVVKPGESVPLDGIVVSGVSAFDTSALTGESLPRDAAAGNEALSGFVNKSGLLTIKVTKAYGESAVSKILDLTRDAAARKAPSENFITKFSRYYTPAVVFGAIALAVLPPMFADGMWADWFGRALVFLVVSCPCALVISVPLSFFGGIGGASKNGILVKGGAYLESLAKTDTVVFDKTGTLTKGVFSVKRIVPSGDFSARELLECAAYAESASTHPIAVSIVEEYGKPVIQNRIGDVTEVPGSGVRANIDGKIVLAGNVRLMEENNIGFTTADLKGTAVHIAVDGIYAGGLMIADSLKPDAVSAVAGLKALGVKKTVILTGDSKANAEKTAAALGVDEVYAGLLPEQKAERLEAIKRGVPGKNCVVFMGDGINDAPVLAVSDVGVAMGGVGSDAAIEAADAVLMTDEPSKLITAIRIAKKTRRIVIQNVVFAIGVKAIVLLLGALGIANMWAAVFGDVGVAVIAILNAMRAMRVN
ncbi:MAG: cadmium-translocating P-type ATPase [Clostridiales bacterium]|jgi:Cd2+/Zn2+-exporting ATPase|nr:cadmium-translocating P-type ATPase [Clostridiales bacterium]